MIPQKGPPTFFVIFKSVEHLGGNHYYKPYIIITNYSLMSLMTLTNLIERI
jgi:hypothetical protein